MMPIPGHSRPWIVLPYEESFEDRQKVLVALEHDTLQYIKSLNSADLLILRAYTDTTGMDGDELYVYWKAASRDPKRFENDEPLATPERTLKKLLVTYPPTNRSILETLQRLSHILMAGPHLTGPLTVFRGETLDLNKVDETVERLMKKPSISLSPLWPVSTTVDNGYTDTIMQYAHGRTEEYLEGEGTRSVTNQDPSTITLPFDLKQQRVHQSNTGRWFVTLDQACCTQEIHLPRGFPAFAIYMLHDVRYIEEMEILLPPKTKLVPRGERKVVKSVNPLSPPFNVFEMDAII